jgi:uncharacterized protein YdeI (YjbR/CyaY-like superfamily)
MAFGFWKAKLMHDPQKLFTSDCDSPMTINKITDIAQLPPDKVLLAYIREAVALNEQGVKVPKKKKPARPATIEVPADLQAALKKNKKALATFEAFSPSQKREYIDWIIEAKQEATREKRLATAIEWMAQGKPRMWKYMKK